MKNLDKILKAMRIFNHILPVIFLFSSINTIGQTTLQIETESELTDAYSIGLSNWKSKGWCESKTIKGEWKDIDEQYVTGIGNEEHNWFYDEVKEPEITGFYACMNCCSIPDYDITQERVCGRCGWIQIKINRVVHTWVTPPPEPKSRFEQIIDSLNKKQ